MVSDSDISFAQSKVRRLEADLSQKKLDGANTPAKAEEVAKMEKELELLRRNLSDLQNRKSNNDERGKREEDQRKRDERRLRPF